MNKSFFKDCLRDRLNLQKEYAYLQVQQLRRSKSKAMPDWLRQVRDNYCDRLLFLARKSYEQTGQWFLTRGAARISDERETKAIWVDLLAFIEIEQLPGYSHENHKAAIAFWKSWQNLETGQLYNPLYQDPQQPHNKRKTHGNRSDFTIDQINMKYVPVILEALGASLPLPIPGLCTQVRADSGEDIFDHLWDSIAEWNTSHAGAFPVDSAMALDDGDLGKITQIEAGMGALLRAYSPTTGMWRPEPLDSFPWHDYQPSSGFKIISRICGYLGMENFPERLLKTGVDNLLSHRNELYDHPAMARNYGETFAHYLSLSDYRRDEQLNAMEQCLNGFRDSKLWDSTATSTYCIFGSGLIGSLMNWSDMPLQSALMEWQRFVQGCTMKWRFVAGPFGNWVNVIAKHPHEVYGNRAFDPSLYSMKSRNIIHWSKRITELIKPSEVKIHLDNSGETGSGKLSFNLSSNQLDQCTAPYLKATWTGGFDIKINDFPVKQVRYNLPEVYAGLYVHPNAADSLRVGDNSIDIKYVKPGKNPRPGTPLDHSLPRIKIGLIDWC